MNDHSDLCLFGKPSRGQDPYCFCYVVKGESMPEFRETTRSYLQRIVPDITDLNYHVHSYLDHISDETRRFSLYEAWADFHKIEAAFKAIEDLNDNQPE